MGRVERYAIHILKNIQFACPQINLLYLGHSALENRPAIHAAGKKNWVNRVWANRFEFPVRKYLHSHECFFKLLGGSGFL